MNGLTIKCVQRLGLLRQMRCNRHIKLESDMSTILTFLIPSLMSLSICKCAFTQTHIFAYRICFLMKSETQDCRKYTNIQMGLYIYILSYSRTYHSRDRLLLLWWWFQVVLFSKSLKSFDSILESVFCSKTPCLLDLFLFRSTRSRLHLWLKIQ